MTSKYTPDLRAETTEAIRPGDDFYMHVNAKWLATHPIPDSKSRLGAFTEISDDNVELLRTRLEAPDTKDAPYATTLAKQFYRAAMAEKYIVKQGITSVRPLLEEIDAIQDTPSLAAFITKQHSLGFDLVWGSGFDVDEKDCTRYVFRIVQYGLGLPDRDYYLEEGERFEEIRNKYRTFLVETFGLLGLSNSAQRADAVISLETDLAKASSTATERRDVVAQYNPFTRGQLAKTIPGFDWPAYLAEVGYTLRRPVIVAQPRFLKAAVELFGSRPLNDWQSYLAFHSVLPLMPALPKPYELLHFGFYGTVLGGATEQEPRYRRVINACMGLLPEPTGRVFTDAYFHEDAKIAIYDLVEHIKSALHRRIEHLAWMSPATKARAFEKLAAFQALLGYPDSWRAYEGLALGDSYVENVRAVRAYEHAYDMSRLTR